MAVESGGNVEGSVLDQVVDVAGVKLISLANLPSGVACNASAMYSANVTHFIDEFWNADEGAFALDPEDEIVSGCVLTRDGEIVNETIKDL